MQVLIADDDEDVRFMVSMLLREEGWQVTSTCSGRETIELLATSTFDALILDLNMPPGSGLEVLESRRSMGDTTPVILFSGFVTAEARLDAERLGATVLEKTDIRQLGEVVAQSLAAR